MEVEYFRYVMHLTSVVKGQLLPELTALDALKSTLPAGTVSGAPKIRAMRRIYELEQEKRGIYAGAIGYLSATGDMDFAIAIRTMILKKSKKPMFRQVQVLSMTVFLKMNFTKRLTRRKL